MALPASPGQISFSDIQTEFGRGGANPIFLSEYYLGGSYVFVTDTVPNVPASGQISVGNFHSAAASAASGHNVTEGPWTYGKFSAMGFSSNADFPGVFGSISNATTIGGRTIQAFFLGSLSGQQFNSLMIAGNETGAWWTFGTYRGNTFYRATSQDPNGTYSGDFNRTTWSLNEAPGFTGSGTHTLILYP